VRRFIASDRQTPARPSPYALLLLNPRFMLPGVPNRGLAALSPAVAGCAHILDDGKMVIQAERPT